MRAGLVTGRERFELVDVPEPRPQPGTAVADVALCGICGTDVHGFLSDRPYNPAICGHEWVGTISAVGPDVRGLREGDRVVAGIAPACGACSECLEGRPDYCVPAFLGMVGRDPLAPPHGGFAPRVALDARRLLPVHGGLSDVQAAMVEPATVALHAVRRTAPRAGETVVVQGCGPIGLFVLQCARSEGADHLVAVEPNDARRALAASLGADTVWTPDEAQAQLADRPADLVFECAGAPPAVQTAVDLVRRGGRVNLVGVTPTATVQPSVWAVKEVTLTGSLGYRHDEFGPVMDLMASGAIQVEPLHDATVALEEAAGAFASLAADSAYAIKVLVDPREQTT